MLWALSAETFGQTVKLNSGYEMPVAGLGTWTLTGKTCENAVYSALKTGVRLIDTAKYYGNEADVGRALEILWCYKSPPPIIKLPPRLLCAGMFSQDLLQFPAARILCALRKILISGTLSFPQMK